MNWSTRRYRCAFCHGRLNFGTCHGCGAEWTIKGAVLVTTRGRDGVWVKVPEGCMAVKEDVRGYGGRGVGPVAGKPA